MSSEKNDKGVNRLCSEIQLFDLCDLDSCSARNGRFCTDEDLLAKFESIQEEDDRPPLVYEDEALDDDPDLINNDEEEYGLDETDDE